MEPYLFLGLVLPERAQLSFQRSIEFTHYSSKISAKAKLSIFLNQIAVWIYSDHDWDIFDLRNIVSNLVKTQLSVIGFLKGYAYDFQIERVLSGSRNIDWVFGIDIPSISQRATSENIDAKIAEINQKMSGENGVLLHRCFNDLTSSMKYAEDTAFYCYRALESLRQHCAAMHGLRDSERAAQWQKFREISGSDEQTLMAIKEAADPLRHGGIAGVTSSDRDVLFAKTWDTVEGYLRGI